ncbi:hypothetical protein F5I97DRAFT_1928686 [Phlebopus sp. FC_14]|nr:hypothetical protein F5I97DRAFT_1928686 [Phlebopus sp. FC_14]
MSNFHELEKTVRKGGARPTDEELKFKKPFQVVDHPLTTDHNVHDDFVKHPPHNVDSFAAAGRGSNQWEKQEAQEIGREGTGRVKQIDFEGEMLNESSVHS